MSGLTCSYMDLRRRGEGDVARTIQVIPDTLLLDVDAGGLALGIEKISDEPITMSDLYACLLRGQFGRDVQHG